jgi:hypothetical protein
MLIMTTMTMKNDSVDDEDKIFAICFWVVLLSAAVAAEQFNWDFSCLDG